MIESQVIAKSDKETFLVETDGEYTILSLTDIGELDIEDVLKHKNWDDYDDTFVRILNLTNEEKIDLAIENWGMNEEWAAYHFQKIGSPSSFVFLKGYSKRFLPYMDVSPTNIKDVR